MKAADPPEAQCSSTNERGEYQLSGCSVARQRLAVAPRGGNLSSHGGCEIPATIGSPVLRGHLFTWTTGCRNGVLAPAAQGNHWPWWAAANIVLLNLFSFKWALEKACVDWDIAWPCLFLCVSQEEVFVQQPFQCFILSCYCSLRCKGVKENRTVRHLRTSLWCPHRMLMCFESSSFKKQLAYCWLEGVLFGQLCNGHLH